MGFDREKPHQERCEAGRPFRRAVPPNKKRDRADYPFRDGCFYDDSGRAHYLSTSPACVLSEVTGRGRDSGAVRNWAWAGGQGDVPGGPSVASWQGSVRRACGEPLAYCRAIDCPRSSGRVLD